MTAFKMLKRFWNFPNIKNKINKKGLQQRSFCCIMVDGKYQQYQETQQRTGTENMWTVVRIDEADYGCEERMPGEPLMALVTVQSDDGRMGQIQMVEEWLQSQEIDEGDEWPEDIDEVSMGMLRAESQMEFMNQYFEAIEEMEGEDTEND